MKTVLLFFVALLFCKLSNGQNARVLLVKHELRWTNETWFPDYFHDTELRDSIFSDTRLELIKALRVEDVAFPSEVEYKIINGFGKQKTEMPADTSGAGPEIAIFSFITRGTTSYQIFWKMNILIREKGKTDFSGSAMHELEYYDASGYFSSRRWLSPEQFRSIFSRLVKESLGSLSVSDEKIILGDPEEKEQLVRSFFPGSERALLKINGTWRDAGNFAALLEAGSDTLVRINYRDGWESESVRPSGSAVFATLFTAITGIDMTYEQKVTREKKGTVIYSDGQKTKIRLRWIEMQERSVKENEGSARITGPMVTEIYDGEKQTGSFLFTRREETHTTDQTKRQFNIFTGYQLENTMGLERTQRIEGFFGETSIFAEFNEYHGIIEVSADSVLLAMMVAQNCNPENRSFGKARMTKNKQVMPGMTIGKQSLDKAEKVEWYPVYLPANATKETGKMCLRILTCLFFGMGNQGIGNTSPE
jgi:hypothetical protein